MASTAGSVVDQRPEASRGPRQRQAIESPEARAEALAEAEARVEMARSRLINAAIAFCDGGISAGQLRAVRELYREQATRLESLTRQAVSPFVQALPGSPETPPGKIPTAPLRPKGVQDTLLASNNLLPELAEMLTVLTQKVGRLEEDFKAGRIEEVLRARADKEGVKAAFFIHALRVLVLGMKVSPGIFDVLELLGKEATIRRMMRLGLVRNYVKRD